MFVLTNIEDTIRVEPRFFVKPAAVAIADQINAKYANHVLVGRIVSSTSEAIRVSMGFFDDIYIPPHLLPSPSAFDYQEQAWFWLLDPASDAQRADPLLSQPEERMYLDTGESIRFVVESNCFYDHEPGPAVGEGKLGDNPGVGSVPGDAGAKGTTTHTAYKIIGSIAGQGLGLLAWWAGAEQVPVEEGEGGEEMEPVEQ
ncbi:DNA-directed RNA polymerase III complex subunit Rpc25 [Malassezia cuniculi]|uniref:DNA-directed RNA polymerase III complex subunit Rpc25 n=1 Tax=Malassezia cuniculi TaxID=948313 RepID=A0AAF0EUB2_9BASI|nr:DNA-directed RNA polymerase III complex subunit Rpc25 [Malassezia cuniculi]